VASTQTRSSLSRPSAAVSLSRPPPHLASRNVQATYEPSFHSGLVGPSYIDFSPSPAPSPRRSPSRSPARPSPSPLDSPLRAAPSRSPSPRLAPAASTPPPVWLGPLPADLQPDEVVALLAPYGHAAFRLHLAETGAGDEAYALEVSCPSWEAASALVDDARAGRVDVRGSKVEALQEDGGGGFEYGEGDEWVGERGGGRPEEERGRSEVEGSVRSAGAHEQQIESAADERYEAQDYLSSSASRSLWYSTHVEHALTVSRSQESPRLARSVLAAPPPPPSAFPSPLPAPSPRRHASARRTRPPSRTSRPPARPSARIPLAHPRTDPSPPPLAPARRAAPRPPSTASTHRGSSRRTRARRARATRRGSPCARPRSRRRWTTR